MTQRVLTLIVCKTMLALMMTACSSSFATSQPPTPTPMSSGTVDVGGYELFYQCSGQGSPSEYPNPEGWDTQTSNAQVKATKPLGDLPLLVISQSPDKPLFAVNIPPLLKGTNAQLQKIWQEMQRELAGVSSNSNRIIATQAGHDIPNEEPELVIEAIGKLVNEDRSH